MADRGDRGGRGGRGGRGRGGGPQEGRGGGRGGRGDAHGGRGDARGGRGDARGGRGDARGTSGGYRGSFSGPPRGGGDHGRGGFDRGRGDRGRGGRGGGRGGRGGFGDEPPVFTVDGMVPQPDPAVTQLEDNIVAQQTASIIGLTAKMGKLKVSAQPGDSALSKELFPARPAYGNRGTKVVLWANYFRVNMKADILYKYMMDVVQVAAPEAEVSANPKGKGKPPTKEVKGRKLYFVIREALKELSKNDKSLILATEFKSQLISLRELNLENNPLTLAIPSEANPTRIDVFEITFHGPLEARVSDMMKYLHSSTGDGPEDYTFPRFPESVDALNVVLGYGPRSKIEDISAVGSSRFFPFQGGGITQGLWQSGHALTAARGFFQSMRLGTGRLLLNTNVTHGVFKLSGKVQDIFDNFGITAVPRTDSRGSMKLRLIAKFLPKTRVWVTMKLANGKEVRRPKAVQSLATASEVRRNKADANPPRFTQNWEFVGPSNVQFWLEGEGGGRYITVADYYKQKYGVTLKNYPLLNIGRADKPTYYPAEFVEIQPGQAVKAKLTGKETTEMLGFACRSPYANAFSIIHDGRKALGLDDEKLGDFGLSVDKQLLVVQGRVLPAPWVSYMDNRQKRTDIAPVGASWNLRNVKVFKGGSVPSWSYVNIELRDFELVPQDSVEKFGDFMGKMGIKINKSPTIPPANRMTMDRAMNGGGLERLFEWAKKERIGFLLVILGTQDTALYGKIKTLGDCTYGIHTSCVQGDKFAKIQPGYFANVALKWNLKAGGVNHKLRDEFGILKDGKTMVVGYDVTHPTNMPMGKGDEIPSLVGLVASIDRDMGQWPAVSWEQKSRQEMLGQPLTDAFKSRLELWQKHNKGGFPENIVIFRDGVSEGQFAQVLSTELPLIRDACRLKCPPKSQPKLTIVVSVKRHQTRFYPTTTEKLPDNRNIQNGTVVDRGVTQARYWDFFLTAHASLKGTARPAHYTVLLDEIFRAKHKAEAANELEKLTHELCYLFGRATKAVSICPPAYYADIVCERARAHRPEFFDVSDLESVTTAGAASSVVAGGKQVHELLRNSMYYI